MNTIRIAILLAVFSAACSTEAPSDPGPGRDSAASACSIPGGYTTIIDHVCSTSCAMAHVQPSPQKGESQGSLPLLDCMLSLDGIATSIVADCGVCPAN